MKMKTVGIFSNGVSHSWLYERNRNRDTSEKGHYQEVELSELMAVIGCSLICVYIHAGGGSWGEDREDGVYYLQADAICVKNSEKRHFFMLHIPSRFDGGHGRYSLSETLPETIWDDIIVHFDRASEGLPQASLPPTWIAAIMGDDVVELDGDLIDYTKAGPHLPSIMRQGASFDYDFDDEFWSASPWDELFAFREFPRKPEDSI